MEDKLDQLKDEQSQLIPGIPDEIAFFCLARVPRKYHAVLKCVCRKWRDLVCSQELFTYRKTHNLSETWIYALCQDKSEKTRFYVLDPDSLSRSWKLIQGLPTRFAKRKGVGIEALENKLYFFGGYRWSDHASDETFCYDIARNSWSKSASISTERCFFASQVLDGKIYAIGGNVSKFIYPRSWDTFDPLTNTWKFHTDPNVFYDVEDSLVFDGKIYIRNSAPIDSPYRHAVFYNPLMDTWHPADSDMMLGWRDRAVFVDGILYMLDQSSGTRLMMWQEIERDWVEIGRLLPLLTRPPCQLVAIGKRIFIIGKGLSTVIFDVEKSAKFEGVVICSSIIGLNSEDVVLSCRSLAL